MSRPSLLACIAAALVVVAACAEPTDAARGPRITGVSATSVRVGETLYFAGHDFVPPEEGATRARFAGTYFWRDDDGTDVQEQVVPFERELLFDGTFDTDGVVGGLRVSKGTSLLRWNRVGPFSVPFGGRGRATGRFEGTVTVIVERKDGSVDEGDPTPLTLAVGPSIVFRRLEPVVGRDAASNTAITAPCGAPALRGLPGLAYVFEVEAVGFVPSTFVWSLAGVNGESGFTTFTHEASGAVDVLGDGARGEVVVLNAIDEGADVNVVTVAVSAFDEFGNVVETVLPLDVVRPIQFFYDGNRTLAQYYEPEVVNGPIVGGIGTVITYSESHSESRQHGVAVNITRSAATTRGTTSTENWNEAYGVTETLSSTEQASVTTSETEQSQQTYGETYSQSAATQVGLSSTNGTSWGWTLVEGQSQEEYQQNVNSMGSATGGTVITEVGGEASLAGLAGVSGKVGSESSIQTEVGREVSAGTRSGARTDRGTAGGGNASATSSYGSVTTDGRSQQVGGSWGLSRQGSIAETTSETAATSESVVLSTGGAESVSEGVTEGVSESWAETWQSTSTDTTLVSFSGKVPNGRCAVIYRQTVRHVRTAWVWQHDLCGVRSEVGELFFNEWSWSPNIAIGDDCTASLPPSTQPAAGCFAACE